MLYRTKCEWRLQCIEDVLLYALLAGLFPDCDIDGSILGRKVRIGMVFGGELATTSAWCGVEHVVGYIECTRGDALWRLWLFISEYALLLI